MTWQQGGTVELLDRQIESGDGHWRRYQSLGAFATPIILRLYLLTSALLNQLALGTISVVTVFTPDGNNQY